MSMAPVHCTRCGKELTQEELAQLGEHDCNEQSSREQAVAYIDRNMDYRFIGRMVYMLDEMHAAGLIVWADEPAEWYSICSAHREYDPDCSACQHGQLIRKKGEARHD